MVKDTARIIMFLECNYKCSYCCNEKEKFNRLFIEKWLSEINFDDYKFVCISGGEPFFRKDVLYKVMDAVPQDKPIFLYTNGVLVDDADIEKLKEYKNLKGINVGMHGIGQLRKITPRIEELTSVRYVAWDKFKNKYLETYPDRLNENNTKFWILDNCYRENEDWILLKDFSS